MLPQSGGIECATYGAERVEDDPVFLRLQSARDAEDAADVQEPVIELPVMPFNTWQVVKTHFRRRWPGLKGVSDANIRILYKSVEMRNDKMVDDYNFEASSKQHPIDLHYFITDRGTTKGQIGLYPAPEVPCNVNLCNKVKDALAGLLSGVQPRLSDEGTGATYFLRDSDNKSILAVLKPKDEEAFAPQNPRGYVGKENSVGLRSGVFSTQQAAREVAAYLLDHSHFAGVPETNLVHVRHPKLVKVKGKVEWKIAAFQLFVDTVDTAGNFSSSLFATASVHRIGILDVRLLNLDRNDGNLLVRTKRGREGMKYDLVPIDHGLSLPDRLEVSVDDMAWMGWPQAKKPFQDAELSYIAELDAARDAKMLSRTLGIRRDCLRLLEVSTMLLQLLAKAGFTLYDIGRCIYRDDSGDGNAPPSELEHIIGRSLDLAIATTSLKSWKTSVKGQVPNTRSAHIEGLDLRTVQERPEAFKKKNAHVEMAAAARRPLLTPQLGPAASPLSSPLSVMASPTCTPTEFALDGIGSSSEAAWSEDNPLWKRNGHATAAGVLPTILPMMGSLPDAKLSNPDESTALAALHETVSPVRKVTAPRGSARFFRKKTEGGSNDLGSIFARPKLESPWSSELEREFRNHVKEEIARWIKKQKRSMSEQQANEVSREEATKEASGDEPAKATPSSPNDMSLASAFPSRFPSDDTGFFACQQRGLWARAVSDCSANTTSVAAALEPPTASTSTAASEAVATAEVYSAPEASQKEEPLALPARRPGAYVPPHLRRAAAAARQGGDSVAVAAADER